MTLYEEFGKPNRRYWCVLCGEAHEATPGSEEQVMKTGWRTVNGKCLNIGFCNRPKAKKAPLHPSEAR